MTALVSEGIVLAWITFIFQLTFLSGAARLLMLPYNLIIMTSY